MVIKDTCITILVIKDITILVIKDITNLVIKDITNLVLKKGFWLRLYQSLTIAYIFFSLRAFDRPYHLIVLLLFTFHFGSVFAFFHQNFFSNQTVLSRISIITILIVN